MKFRLRGRRKWENLNGHSVRVIQPPRKPVSLKEGERRLRMILLEARGE